jgi:hypothetical protein
MGRVEALFYKVGDNAYKKGSVWIAGVRIVSNNRLWD